MELSQRLASNLKILILIFGEIGLRSMLPKKGAPSLETGDHLLIFIHTEFCPGWWVTRGVLFPRPLRGGRGGRGGGQNMPRRRFRVGVKNLKLTSDLNDTR